MRTSPPLLAPVFRTEGQAAILAAVLLTDERIGLPELARRTSLPRSSVHREVTRLAEAGILTVETIGREWQIAANEHSALVAPLRQIVLAVFGPKPMLTEALSGIPGVEAAWLFGSFAARATGVPGPPPRDIDVLVIGTPDARDVYNACRRVGVQVSRSVNATVMTRAEWDSSVATKAAFATDVFASPMIALLDGQNRAGAA